MRYKSFRVQNYKGIEDVKIEFGENRILTLVGLNESGKTTILESLYNFFVLVKGRKFSKAVLNAIRPKSVEFSNKIVLSALLELNEQDKKTIKDKGKKFYQKLELDVPDTIEICYSFEYELSEFKKNKEEIIFDIKHSASKKAKGLTEFLKTGLINEVKELVPEILYYEDFIFEIPNKIRYVMDYNAEDADDRALLQDSPKNSEWQYVFDDILKSVTPNLKSFQGMVVDKWDDDNDTARQRLSIMEKQLDNKITKAWKHLFEDGDTEQRLNFKEIKIVPNVESDRVISFSFKVKTDAGSEFFINERSKGCKWFFSFLIFTEFRKNRSENILFLLDEPASNLHSSAQLKILSALSDLSKESVVIYSTHSHHLINPKWLNGAYVVLNEGITDANLIGDFTDSKTSIRVNKYFNHVAKGLQKDQTIYYQPIFDMLSYKRSLVELAPDTIICEGKYDWYTYKYMFEEILCKKNLKLYPGKGCYNNSDAIRFCLSWGSNFLLFMDGDAPSVKAKKQYLKEFQDYISDRIVTISEIINENVAAEDIFTNRDKETVCDEVFGQGTFKKLKGDSKALKSKFNYGISILLNSKGKVTFDAKTLDKFEKIHRFLEGKFLS